MTEIPACLENCGTGIIFCGIYLSLFGTARSAAVGEYCRHPGDRSPWRRHVIVNPRPRTERGDWWSVSDARKGDILDDRFLDFLRSPKLRRWRGSVGGLFLSLAEGHTDEYYEVIGDFLLEVIGDFEGKKIFAQ